MTQESEHQEKLLIKDRPDGLAKTGTKDDIASDWLRYAALRSQETVDLADRVRELTSSRRLRADEAEALLLKLKQGAVGFTQTATVMQSQQICDDLIAVIGSLSNVWLNMIDLVHRHRDLVKEEQRPKHLRIVVSNLG